MKITELRARTVLVPIEAPLRHSYSVHRVGFPRTILEIFTDEGLIGLGETTSLATPEQFATLRPVLIGEDPFNLERILLKISQRRYTARQGALAFPVECACLDIQSQMLRRPLHDLLGGRIREEVDVAAYLFYRYPGLDGNGEVTTPEQMVQHAQELVTKHGFRTLKLKGGVFPPRHDVEVIRALRAAFPQAELRLDPNATWAPETAIRMGRQLIPLDLEYYEDPTWGLAALGAVKERVPIPVSTNMFCVEFEDVSAALSLRSVDVILSDPWYWGGLRATKTLSVLCATLGLGMGMHSGLELGVGLAAMLHVAATIPNLVHAIDAHYHHLTDDILCGGPLRYEGGKLKPPTGPGLGVRVDEAKMEQYGRLFQERRAELAAYPHDPWDPNWYTRIPAW